jgi:phosphoribosylformylglycinamidine cyclo-ligase
MKKVDVITGENIRPGLSIVGLSSSGQATYEDSPNSGIGSNGLTSARHDLLSKHYARKYPETYDALTQREFVYTGPYRLTDKLPGLAMSVGQALLSPTRSYAPVITALLQQHPKSVKGVVHCSGGGQTKCLRFGRGVHYVKDAMMKPPPIFRAIQKASKTPWKEMYQVYNMGHRMEVYCTRRDVRKVIDAAQAFGIEAQVVGHTEKSAQQANCLTLMHGARRLEYVTP